MSNANGADPAGSAGAARSLLEAGVAASQNHESPRALSLFAQASAAMPQWGLPHFLSGSEYAALGDWPKAEAELASAVLLAPRLHLARYQLGLLQFSSARPAAALVTWRPLLRESEEPSLSCFVQGFAALAQDAFEEARDHFQRGLSQPAVNPGVAGDVAKVLEKLPGASSPPDKAADQAPVQAQSHVLVANYDRFKLH